MSLVDSTTLEQKSRDKNSDDSNNSNNGAQYNNMSTIAERRQQLQRYLSLQYVDFDQEVTTDRLRSLYSDFSKLKVLNPYGYEANIKYWRAVILDCSLHGFLSTQENSCYIDINELTELFHRRQLGKPLTLGHVVEEMSKEEAGELILQSDYEKRYPIKITIVTNNEGWIQWIYHWMIPKEAPKHLFIVVPTVKEYARNIVDRHYQKPLCSSLDNLLTFLEFKELYGVVACYPDKTVQLSDLDLIVILRYLHAFYGVDIEETPISTMSNVIIIKFPGNREAIKGSAKIVDNDKAIVKLKSMCAHLGRQVEELQAKSEQLLNLSRDQLRNNHKSQTLYLLRKKQKVEGLLEKNLKVLETMETVLLRIETAQNDLQIVNAFNLGATTLRTLVQGKDYNVDAVQETMDRLQDTLEEHKEVEDSLLLRNQEIHNEEMGGEEGQKELEDELNNLINDEKVAQHQQHQQQKHQKQEAAGISTDYNSSYTNTISQPIDTESELLRLQTVLSSLNDTLTSPPVITLQQNARRSSSSIDRNKEKNQPLLSSQQ